MWITRADSTYTAERAISPGYCHSCKMSNTSLSDLAPKKIRAQTVKIMLHRGMHFWFGHYRLLIYIKKRKKKVRKNRVLITNNFVEILYVFFLSLPITFSLSPQRHTKEAVQKKHTHPGPFLVSGFTLLGQSNPGSSELEQVTGSQETPDVPCTHCFSFRTDSPHSGLPDRHGCHPAGK